MSQAIHPALWNLAKMRAQGRLHSMLASLTQPRKLLVSILGTILAAVWLSNVIASILFREQYHPESLRTWMTMMLAGYGAWHLVRVSWSRPESSIEWTDAERNNLLPSPFTRKELIQYRLLTVLGVTLFKAMIGTLLLLPDFPIPILGFTAMFCGLMFVEIIRLTADTLAAGLSDRAYRIFRTGVVGTVVLAGVACGIGALQKTQTAEVNSSIPVVFQFAIQFLDLVKEAFRTPVGEWLSAPFVLFVNVMTAKELDAEIPLCTLAGLSIIVVGIWTLFRLDRWSQAATIRREKLVSTGLQNTPANAETTAAPTNTRFPQRIVSACGGAVVWRQMVGVYRHGTGVVLALIPPAILAAMPLFMTRLDDRLAILNFLGGLIFYSFLLIPSALKFDFRRDYSHLVLLKMLPLPPWKVVVGQLATPVIITTLFQYGMLFFATLVREVSIGVLLAAIVSFPAMNLAVYGWENLMFLIFPQKLKQEGIEVFLRTTVMFTAKGVACAIVFAMIFVWALVASQVASAVQPYLSLLGDRRLIFGLGVWFAVSTVGLMMTVLAARQFRLMEPIPESQSG